MLRDVFGFDFAEIASAVGRSEAACRQLAVRARRHMDDGRPRLEADRREREEPASRFFDALREGDVDGLRGPLAADVQMVGDGGGKAPAFARGIHGVDNVARLLATYMPTMTQVDAGLEPHELNGQPGAILRDAAGNVLGTLVLQMLDNLVQSSAASSTPTSSATWAPSATHGRLTTTPSRHDATRRLMASSES